MVLTAADLLRRLLALIPPRGQHLTCFHGLFAPNAKLRGALMKAPAEPEKSGPPLSTLANAKPKQSHTPPRVDWATLQRRTFGNDVWECPCGGRRESPRRHRLTVTVLTVPHRPFTVPSPSPSRHVFQEGSDGAVEVGTAASRHGEAHCSGKRLGLQVGSWDVVTELALASTQPRCAFRWRSSGFPTIPNHRFAAAFGCEARRLKCGATVP